MKFLLSQKRHFIEQLVCAIWIDEITNLRVPKGAGNMLMKLNGDLNEVQMQLSAWMTE